MSEKKSTSITELADESFNAGKIKKEFAIKDIYTAAFLHALGYKLEFARSDGYQAEFYFKNVPAHIIIQYMNDEPHPDMTAKKLFDAFQNMRRISRQVRVVQDEGHSDDD